MNKHLEKALVKKYPKLFKNMYGDPKKTCMAWGCDCGDGWYFLLNTLCLAIQDHTNQQNKWVKMKIPGEEPVKQTIFRQVKEKFGALRIYSEGGDAYTRAITAFTEILSIFTCENCGKMDQTIGRTQGWIQSLCPTCAEAYKKPIVQRKKEIALWKKVIATRTAPLRAWKTVEELTPEDFKQPKPIKKRKKK